MIRCICLIALLLNSVASGEVATDYFSKPPPLRPDFSKMSEEEATAAAAVYRQAYAEWEKQEEAPAREAAIQAAVARQQQRIQQRAEEEKSGVEHTTEPKSTVGIPTHYEWRTDAVGQGLSAAAVVQLQRDGLVIAGPSYKQSFSVYGESGVVPFVTSDSLLNGFHVLLEATLKRFESRRALRLRALLEDTWTQLPRRLAATNIPRQEVEPYSRHLVLAIGPAMRLLGSEVVLGDAALESEVAATVAKIRAADVVLLPSWLAPQTPQFLAIDFRRCRPTGFYADTETLSDYYRAVRWLQMVPFRSSRPIEVGAAALFLDLNRDVDWLRAFVESGEEIWGGEDGPSFAGADFGSPRFLEAVSTKSIMEALRISTEGLQRSEKYRQSTVRDTLRTTDAGIASTTLLAGTALPDAVLLVRLAEKSGAAGPLPGSVEVGAWLRSALAEQISARSSSPAAWREAIDAHRRNRDDFYPTGRLPESYYWVLESLFAPVDPAAPEFMRSELWQRKSLQTALSGWAQLRHAWELQAKLAIFTAGMETRPAGFVEPNPLFFQRLTMLADRTIERFQTAGVFSEGAEAEMEFLNESIRYLERIGAGKVEITEDIPGEQTDLVVELESAAERGGAPVQVWGFQNLKGEAQKQNYRELLKAIRTRVDRLKRGERVVPLDSRSYRRDPDRQLFERWQELRATAARLATMVEKQLRQAEWRADEAHFLQNYQESLGTIMGYFGSAAHDPEDDAPRIASVWHDPQRGEILHTAIGRPRALYVLYPWKGTLVLARGAVLPFHEIRSTNRYDDAAWRKRLDADETVAQPEWILPLAPDAQQARRVLQ
ncbi:MAG: DUF3160 domain-containing protein [Opitutae bacterium]|nr:DUF3160 domain-containing protein [Opitutae bacterium]